MTLTGLVATARVAVRNNWPGAISYARRVIHRNGPTPWHFEHLPKSERRGKNWGAVQALRRERWKERGR